MYLCHCGFWHTTSGLLDYKLDKRKKPIKVICSED